MGVLAGIQPVRALAHSRYAKRGTSDKQEHRAKVTPTSCEDKEVPDRVEVQRPVVENEKYGACGIAQSAGQQPNEASH